jgi:type I restriction enzyme M protein
MDYAAGSGHFLTETMHEMQRLLDKKDDKKYHPSVAKKIRNWKDDHFAWAIQYVYGIEKDYRLVKVGKVGCYLHGDGLANVIHSDGLANFSHPDYKGKLLSVDKDFPKENKQFDIIVSNPPYSVSAFKNSARSFYKDGDFDLYNRLTDNSSEIECLFIERTKQLLKDGGVAGIILPSSILSNTGIYSKSRELILQYFDIVGITELGSNTFMATGTNTVTLFLRRRNNYESINLKIAVEKFFTNHQDVTLNGVEKPGTKYINHVWEGISFEDYISLLKKEPNKTITEHEIYKEYQKKLKAKNDKEFWTLLLERETDKLYYFILAYPQKVVLVKSGEKDAEKRFLGYEFSNRRGSEGIHPMQRGKNIEDCTQLFDAEVFDNPSKASTYIYKAFAGDYDFAIDEAMQNNVSRHNLVDMMTFDRVEFEKNISLSIKKKVKIESKWELKKLGEVCEIFAGGDVPKDRFSKNENQEYNIPIYSNGIEKDGLYGYTDKPRVVEKCITISERGTIGFTKQRLIPFYPIVRLLVLIPNKNLALVKFLELISNEIEFEQYAVGTPQLTVPQVSQYKIPLPPIDIQQKIVSEIEVLEAQKKKAKEEVEKFKIEADEIFNKINSSQIVSLEDISENLDSLRKPVTKGYRENGDIPYYGASGIVDYVSDYIIDDYVLLISEDGANLKARTSPIAFTANGKIWVNNHAHILKFKEKATHKLVEIYINRTDISEYITGQAQPKLNQQNLNNIKIPLPPLSEQQKIVSEIEKIELKIAILETEIAEIPKLKEAVLKKYL